MIDRVERGRHVEQPKYRNSFLIGSSQDIGHDLKYCCLRRVTCAEAGLMLWQHIISFQEGNELVADHSVNKFRHVGEIGNWPVVLDIILIQSLLLDDWFHNGMWEHRLFLILS